MRLTKTDLNAIEAETAMLAGVAPSAEQLRAAGVGGAERINAALDTISATGRLVTLMIAETIQAAAALVIAVVFAVLEYYRVQHGALALGQSHSQAVLIAAAVVTANIVHPIYSLRQIRGQTSVMVRRSTLRGALSAWWRRLAGRPVVESVDLYHNPTLHIAAAVITWSTIVLAVYDIVGPLVSEFATGQLSRPLIIALMELLMGLGLSVSGVFFLQSAAHEIGVRTQTDQPQRLADVLAQRTAEHQARVEAIRVDVRERYAAAKLAELERKQEHDHPAPFSENGASKVTSLRGN
jgi:hypothetical protein